MTTIDKIIKSETTPKTKNVLWLNTNDHVIYCFIGSDWVPISQQSKSLHLTASPSDNKSFSTHDIPEDISNGVYTITLSLSSDTINTSTSAGFLRVLTLNNQKIYLLEGIGVVGDDHKPITLSYCSIDGIDFYIIDIPSIYDLNQDETLDTIEGLSSRIEDLENNSSTTGFFIGDESERLSLEPQNGYVFNQVEEDGTVHRYFYEQNEWVLLANPDVHDTEEVIFNINSNDGLLNLSELTVQVLNTTTGVSHSVQIDSVGEGVIYIPIGESYNITFPSVTDYATNTYEFSYTAERYVRTINIVYRHVYSDYNQVAKYFIVEESSDPTCETGGSDAVLERILSGRVDSSKPISGTYVIDEEHKKYAKLDPTDHTYFEDGTTWNGSYGNSFRYLPQLYIHRDTSYTGNGTKYYISDINFTGAEHPIVLPESWIGVYKAYYDATVGKICSRPNLAATGNITISNFQLCAKNNGANYGIDDYKNWQKLCALFIAKYSTTNVDSTDAGVGMAATSSSSYYNIAGGTTISLGDATGKVEYQDTGLYQCKLFGIEAPWGQQWEFLKGIYFNGSIANVYDANTYTTAETPTRTFQRLTSGSSSYITSLVKGDNFDVLPSAAGNGTSASYYCDGYWGASGNNLLAVGGSSGDGFLSGLFCGGSNGVFSFSSASSGARLCFYGDISEYELITGAEMAALNSNS